MSDNSTNPVPLSIRGQISRRDAIQWVMAAAAASSIARGGGDARSPQSPASPDHAEIKGYGVDPKLMFDPYKPGAFWPLTFSDAQRKTATALADVIIPKDDLGPAASAVGVPAMIDEWISAPYPSQQADRPIILEGLAWLDAESGKRFGKDFASLDGQQARAICDDICYIQAARPEFGRAAVFFSRFRSICAGAYYGTPEGWKAIGYVGNVILPKFDGPPPEVLQRLGVTQTVA